MPILTIECYNRRTADRIDELLRDMTDDVVRLASGEYCLADDAQWVESARGYYHTDDCSCCDRCGDSYLADSSEEVLTEDGHRYCCEDCAERDDYIYCDAAGGWVTAEEAAEYASDLADYSTRTPHDAHDSASEDHPWRVGLEIEKEDGRYLEGLHGSLPYGWLAKRDGSLNDDGYEIVSPALNLSRVYAPGYADRHDLATVFDQVGSALDGNTSERCGGHIHLSRYGWSGEDLAARMADRWSLLYALYAPRLRSSYAKPKKLPDTISHDRFRAINVLPDRVELRLISRVRDREQLIWRVTLLAIICAIDDRPMAEQLADDASLVRQHLAAVYSPEQIARRITLFERFAKWREIPSLPPSAEIADYIR